MIRIRRFIVFCIRLSEGCKQLIKKPWKALLLSVVIFGFVILFTQIAKIRYAAWIPIILQNIFVCALIGIAIAFCAFVLSWLLKIFGTPFRAKSIEASLAMAFSQNDLRFGCPTLLTSETSKDTGIVSREFYSKGIPLTRWEAVQPIIEDALNCYLVEKLCYGGKNGNDRNRIVMISNMGVYKTREGILYDELL